MNCEAYILQTGSAGGFKYYPDNIDYKVLRGICEEANEDDSLVIRRQGDMIYYIYLRWLDNDAKKRVGIAVGVNMIVIDDVAALHKFFQRTLRTLANAYYIAEYNKTTNDYSMRAFQLCDAAINRLRNAFNSHFDESGAQAGAINYATHPGQDFLRLKDSGTVVRLSPTDSHTAQLTVRQSIEQGNTIIVESELTDEQEIARLNAKVLQFQQKISSLQNRIEEQQRTISQQDNTISQLRKSNNNLRQEVASLHHIVDEKSGRSGDNIITNDVIHKEKEDKRWLYYLLVFSFFFIITCWLIPYGVSSCSGSKVDEVGMDTVVAYEICGAQVESEDYEQTENSQNLIEESPSAQPTEKSY